MNRRNLVLNKGIEATIIEKAGLYHDPDAKVVFRHYRSYLPRFGEHCIDAKGGATILVVLSPLENKLALSASICSTEDVFDKVIARNVAIKRFLADDFIEIDWDREVPIVTNIYGSVGAKFGWSDEFWVKLLKFSPFVSAKYADYPNDVSFEPAE